MRPITFTVKINISRDVIMRSLRYRNCPVARATRLAMRADNSDMLPRFTMIWINNFDKHRRGVIEVFNRSTTNLVAQCSPQRIVKRWLSKFNRGGKVRTAKFTLRFKCTAPSRMTYP